MGKRQRASGGAAASAVDPPWAAPAEATSAAGQGAGPAGVAALLAAAIALAPALGVPSELMLQDTLKSIVVSFAALLAALLFFWQRRASADPVRWHPVLWLPLLLLAYALGSMAWSHTYLAAVEAIRWFVFALLLWLGLNAFTRERLPLLAWGIHAGAVLASLWAALQFWIDFRFFPQGPNPASTFVNRNFFAEFVVCTLPFSALLLARERRTAMAAALAASTALVVVAILMTGTRAALIALWLQLLVVLPLVAWRLRSLPRAGVVAVLLGGVLAMGLIPSGNARILGEGRGTTALERGLDRTASIQPGDPSLQLRALMWKATLRVIEARPLTGVGAGAWEAMVPLYQPDSQQLETDYYVHNEALQLLAEYGLVGALLLAGLLGYLLAAAWRTWRLAGGPHADEVPWRAAALSSLLALLLVSNVGFPWRMAATGALFALALGLLAASDARLGLAAGRFGVRTLAWGPRRNAVALAATLAGLLLAGFITQQAAEAERKIVRATQIAYRISASGQPGDPRWDPAKARVLELTREAVAITPHYRKITPIVADQLASWGDWRNATWIWESVLQSRPYVVAILTNAARGHAAMNEPDRAFEYLARAQAIAPQAPSVLSLEVILLSRFRDAREALPIARQALASGHHDFDLVNNAFVIAWRSGDHELAQQAMQTWLRDYPQEQVQGYLQLGLYRLQARQDEAGALQAWRRAYELGSPRQRQGVLQRVPPRYRERVAAGG
ncbi:O-antigen ligase family protein [Ramlibacter tataouinensis]|uniref:O-antigen ligase family protein n=1 Tax=Ramlibacter tataouinensis TaxID=94132 RepID=UPI0022F3DCF9|nr:O-antigen ligase family protein [Ramlibacter tataouinensis]WBY02013.1 O-antigen ligase family protein [Ramlibacter tataouinensis]